MNKNSSPSLDCSKEIDEFLTDSENSSLEKEYGPDILKIKQITESLTGGLKKDLVYYKKMRKIFNKQEKNLKQRTKLLQEEVEITGNLNVLKTESLQLNDKIRELKENLSSKSSRIITTEAQQNFSISETKIEDFISSMKYELSTLKEKYNITKDQLNNILCSDNREVPSQEGSFKIEKEGNNVGCRCLIS